MSKDYYCSTVWFKFSASLVLKGIKSDNINSSIDNKTIRVDWSKWVQLLVKYSSTIH